MTLRRVTVSRSLDPFVNTYPDYANHDAVALAGLVRDRHIHPRDLVTAAIERIEERDGEINAVVFKRYDRSLRESEAPLADTPLCGVPFLVKDLGQTVSGTTSTLGSKMLRYSVAGQDSNLVRRHKAAGLLIVGLTNTPEFGAAATTEPEVHGPTRNPWDLEYSSGGSSGGAAAAVAAGYTPVAHASDGAGSIRIPASLCGLFGLKPTRARTPKGPNVGEGWFGLSVDHAVTTTVRDSAALLDLTHGADPGAPYPPPPAAESYLAEVGRPPGTLRVAVSTEAMLGTELDPEVAATVESTATMLEGLGHKVTIDRPVVNKEAIGWAGTVMLASDIAAGIERAAEAAGRKPDQRLFEKATWLFGIAGKKVSGRDLAVALNTVKMTGRTIAPFFDDYDVLVEATVATPPWKLGGLDPTSAEARLLELVLRVPTRGVIERALKQISGQAFDNIPNTPLWNITGQPSMSVPLNRAANGLPIGTQFTARYGDETTLFRLAAQLEAAHPWPRHPVGVNGRQSTAPGSSGSDNVDHR